ncbi:MAG: DUF2911 domain-containing protein [Cyclobacteriaceae bacterium]
MKFKSLTIALALMLTTFFVFAQDKPRPSPEGSASTKVGFTDIEINYFRPQMKGRKIFGDGDGFLTPYGKLWRAGANGGTKIKFSTAVKVGGKDLAAGEYLLLATPGKSSWTVLFYKDTSIGGNMSKVVDSNIAAKVTVNSEKLGNTVETLTYNITDISKDSTGANIQLAWENTSVKIPVKVTL